MQCFFFSFSQVVANINFRKLIRKRSLQRGIETTGAFRSIYMEGPPNRGENTEDYITQVAVPIQKTGV